MKKNVIFRIAAIVLMCTLVTACFASSTFAKYTSSQTATATGKVAKWYVKYNGKDLSATNPGIEFDLFKAANIQHHHTNDVPEKIAPGTNGTLSFDGIRNDSDVDAQVVIKITSVTTNGVPIVIKQGDTVIVDKDGTIKNDGIIYDNTVNANSDGSAVTGLTWTWIFEDGRDGADTDLGVAARAAGGLDYVVNFEIVATQLD